MQIINVVLRIVSTAAGIDSVYIASSPYFPYIERKKCLLYSADIFILWFCVTNCRVAFCRVSDCNIPVWNLSCSEPNMDFLHNCHVILYSTKGKTTPTVV